MPKFEIVYHEPATIVVEAEDSQQAVRELIEKRDVIVDVVYLLDENGEVVSREDW